MLCFKGWAFPFQNDTYMSQRACKIKVLTTSASSKGSDKLTGALASCSHVQSTKVDVDAKNKAYTSS